MISLDPLPVDADNDGFTVAEGDCDDTSAAPYPGATDIAGDGIDQNCNGVDSIEGDSTAPMVAITNPVEDQVVTAPARDHRC